MSFALADLTGLFALVLAVGSAALALVGVVVTLFVRANRPVRLARRQGFWEYYGHLAQDTFAPAH